MSLRYTLYRNIATRFYRAPEILVVCDNYSTGVDIWSVGCIFAELIERKPLFPGVDGLDQLHKVCDLIGRPSANELDFVTSSGALKFLLSIPESGSTDLNSKFPDLDPQAIDLLKKLLAFDPAHRISAVDALKHPYLSELRDEDDEPDAGFVFDWSYEMKKLELIDLQELVFNEVAMLHPEIAIPPDSNPIQAPSGAESSAFCGEETVDTEKVDTEKAVLDNEAAGLPPNFLSQFDACVSVDLVKLIQHEDLANRRKEFLNKKDLSAAKEIKEQLKELEFSPPSDRNSTSMHQQMQSLYKELCDFYYHLCDQDDVDEDVLEINLSYQKRIEDMLKLFKSKEVTVASPSRTVNQFLNLDRISLASPLSEAFTSSGKCLLLDGHFSYANTVEELFGQKVKLFLGENALEEAQREFNFMVNEMLFYL